MNYEKEYKGRFKAAKKIYDAPDTELVVKKAFESVFPQLAESEDERTIRELIEEVKDQIDNIPSPDCRDKEDNKALRQLNRWLAYLEKQREQKPIEWSDEDKLGLQNTIALIQGYKDCNEKDEYCVEGCDYSLNWLKSLRERHLWRPSEEQIRVFEYFVIYVCECNLVLKENKNKLTSLLEQLKAL